MKFRYIYLVIGFVFLVTGCISTKVEKTVENEKPLPVTSKEQNKQEKKTVVQTNSVKNTEKETPKEFVVTKEIYKQTFDAIKETILKLNEIIRERNYEKWKTYLTKEYIEKMSDPAFLSKLSESPILKRNGIVLKTLKDYFVYVVVPSRADARLDKIEIIDKTHVKAITIINNNPTILYWLEKVNNQWKVGVME